MSYFTKRKKKGCVFFFVFGMLRAAFKFIFMKIAILGSQGRLGQELVYFFQEEHEVVPLSRFNIDIQDYAEVVGVLSQINPDLVINAAARTESPDAQNSFSEDDIFQTNTAGAAHIAMFCKQNNVPFIHISCASVLAGSALKTESGKRKSVEMIGQSKLEAEEMIERIYADAKQKNYFILRTGMLFGDFGPSLVHGVLKMIEKKTQIEAVSDVFYSFSSTKFIAEFLGEQIKTVPFSGKIQHCVHPETFSVAELVSFFAEKKGKNIEVKLVSAADVEEIPGDFSLQSEQKSKSMLEYL